MFAVFLYQILPQEMLQTTQNCGLICCAGDCMPRSFPYFLFPHLFISLYFLGFFFGKDLCQIIMEGNLKCIRGSGVFVYTNFFSYIPVFFLQKQRKMTV